MQKVMGGEFQIDNSMLHSTSSKHNTMLSSGRSALFAILQSEQTKFGGGTILVPNYLCDCVTNTIKDAGWNYIFYNIEANLMPNINKIKRYENIDAVLVINYYGMVKLEESINEIRRERPDLVIIEDDVQAFFEYEISKADYSFTSLRKWFPSPDGALIDAKEEFRINNTVESKWSQYKFAGNILKNYTDVIDETICLELLQKGEELLDTEYQSISSEISQIIFSNINLKDVAAKRKDNAKYLHENLLKLGIKHIYEEDAIPLFVPIFIKNRNALKKYFYKNNIFTPVHWPQTSIELNGDNDLYMQELSLICDQRYNREDMERQIGVLKHFLNGEER